MAAPVGQNNWRFCSKCFSLWYNGLPTNGVCPVGGAHEASAHAGGANGPASWDYIVVADPVLFPGE
jgi:hypothetical protein